MVLIHIPDAKRIEWPTGIIQELIAGRDGRARAALVRTPNGKTINRPIKRLFPLEAEGKLANLYVEQEPDPDSRGEYVGTRDVPVGTAADDVPVSVNPPVAGNDANARQRGRRQGATWRGLFTLTCGTPSSRDPRRPRDSATPASLRFCSIKGGLLAAVRQTPT